jgi:hypothetical protein
MKKIHFSQVVPLDGGIAQLWTVTIDPDGYLCKVWNLSDDQMDELNGSDANSSRPAFFDHPTNVKFFSQLVQVEDFFAPNGTPLLVVQVRRFLHLINASV